MSDGKVSPASAIALEGIDLSLGRGPARVHVLRGISLSVGRGEAVGLVGPSGSGKSTLLMVMAGLERPDSGRVVVEDTDLVGLDEDALARFRGRRIGIVFQSFHLVPTMTALENVALPLELADRPGAHERARAELEAVGLGHRLHHYPAQLSGGEQQRVALARALINKPTILLADEPTGNLDSKSSRAVIETFIEAKDKMNATIFMVTHDSFAASFCDRVILLKDGTLYRQLEKDGSRSEFQDELLGVIKEMSA